MRPRFESLFRSLITAFVRYDDTPRDMDNVTQLAQARIRLDDARDDMASERDIVLGLGRSRVRDMWDDQAAAARWELFIIANSQN